MKQRRRVHRLANVEERDICARCGCDTSEYQGGVRVGGSWVCIDPTGCDMRVTFRDIKAAKQGNWERVQ